MTNQDRGSKAGASSSKMIAWVEAGRLYITFFMIWNCACGRLQFGALGVIEDGGDKVRVIMTGFSSGSVVASELFLRRLPHPASSRSGFRLVAGESVIILYSRAICRVYHPLVVPQP